MSPDLLFNLIIAIILVGFLMDRLLSYLNDLNWKEEIPEEMKDVYNEDKYLKARAYEKARSGFSLISSLYSLALILGMLFLDGFAYLDSALRPMISNSILLSLGYFALLFLASDILSLPFSLYSNFVIEERFGFNKMSLAIFIKDKLKSWLIGGLIGGLLLYAFLWFYNQMGSSFWIPIWIILSVFGVFMSMFYTTLIVPIFNKLTPLEEGDLKSAIEKYCSQEGFALKHLYVIDGSKRSSKSNAYFSGLGPKKTIVLYDTLIENQEVEEIVAVLAHEIGHYKRKHTLKGMILSFLQSALMLYLMSLLLGLNALGAALGADQMSVHLGLISFSLLYSPVSTLLGIGMNVLSRKHEYEADAFAGKTYKADKLISALQKLSVDNLSNLTPHPAYVFVHYSHPPIVHRLRALKKML